MAKLDAKRPKLGSKSAKLMKNSGTERAKGDAKMDAKDLPPCRSCSPPVSKNRLHDDVECKRNEVVVMLTNASANESNQGKALSCFHCCDVISWQGRQFRPFPIFLRREATSSFEDRNGNVQNRTSCKKTQKRGQHPINEVAFQATAQYRICFTRFVLTSRFITAAKSPGAARFVPICQL